MFLLLAVVTASIYLIFTRTSQNAFEPERIQTTSESQFSPQNSQAPSAATPVPPEAKRDELAEQFKAAAESLFRKAKETKPTEAPTEAALAENAVAGNASRAAAPTIATSPRITAHFLEVPQAAVATLFTGSDGGTHGLLPAYELRYAEASRSEPKPRELTRASKNFGPVNVPIRFDQILNENTGLYIRLTPTAVSESQISVDVNIQFRGTNAQGTAANQEMEGSYVLTSGSAVFFANPIPGTAYIRQEELQTYRTHPVFKVLTSESYISNSSEFLVFFEVHGLE